MIIILDIAVMEQMRVCPKCETEYSDENPPKKLINCEHVICLACLANEILCPIDRKRIERRKYTIEAFQTHEELLKIITGEQSEDEEDEPEESKEKSSQEQQPAEEEQDHSEANTDQVSLLENEAENEIIREEVQDIQGNETLSEQQESSSCFSKKTESFEKEKSSKEEPKSDEIRFEMCLLHGKPAELICLQDKCLICANCGLFGEHKHHSLLAYDTFATNFSSKAELCLITLTKLTEKAAEIHPSLLGNQIERLIQQKQKKEHSNIKKIAQQLIEAVNKLQKEMIEQVDVELACMKQRLLRNTGCQELLRKKYSFECDFQKIERGISDLLQMQNIQEYLGFVDQNHPKSYLNKEGEYLIIEMENHIKSFHTTAEKAISSIAVSTNPNPKEALAHLFSLQTQNALEPQLKVTSPKAESASPPKSYKEVRSLPKDTPNHKKKAEDDLLIRGSHSGEVKRSPSCVRLMSPIRPIPSFEETFDSRFKEQYRHSIITPKEEPQFMKSNSTSLNYHKPVARFSMVAPKLGMKKEADLSLMGPGKPRSNNSSHVVERQILNVLNERNTNRKKKKLDLPAKYAKIYDDLQRDKVDVLDLGGAGLGDSSILTISELLPSRSRLKSVKLMNNKITDEALPELLSKCQRIHSLNLSYNCLTQRSLHCLEQEAGRLGGLTNITLSNNKIVLRNVKDRLEALKRRGIKISL